MRRENGTWFVSEEHSIGQDFDTAKNPDIYIELQGYGTVATIGGGTLEDRRRHAQFLVTAANANKMMLDTLEVLHARLFREQGGQENSPWAPALEVIAKVIKAGRGAPG